MGWRTNRELRRLRNRISDTLHEIFDIEEDANLGLIKPVSAHLMIATRERIIDGLRAELRRKEHQQP